MELFLNATSPYARMARIILLEKGLMEDVTLRWCDPWADDPALLAVNPAGRIPVLITSDGTALSESLLIAVYLDAQHPNSPIVPAAQRAEVLRLAGLGQNLMDASFTTVIARKHYGAEIDQSELGVRRQRAIQRLTKQLSDELHENQLTESLTLGDISTAVALDYLAFRLPEVNWQETYPQLQAWHAKVVARESFQSTAFA
ncbi:glutathione S-transferase N-terminal domain-containing protein [Halomonas sp. 7T]|uniref:glutathione S-transferase family protein n=1 Tax=Halomonas sp. 7T TaxID=2893469 RepID=UPI0021D989AA|nr:glutathione S-transferase N-terminal domain-containing protein [Halomonas sp. 7T]UXZ54934.1 glutathione S-transferase N-terminal domain-containing protein [Halomonas sp. 7T]